MYAILIPALNESKKIGAIVKECLNISDIVLVVDDGSMDDTSEKAKKAGAQILRNENNIGLGGALNKGLLHLFNNNVNTVVTIDGDGAHNTSLIPKIVDFHNKMNADITIGSRLFDDEKLNDFPCPKRSANKLGALFLKYYCNINISDVASGMRVVSNKYINLAELANGYGFTFDLLCSASTLGYKIIDFPIDVRYDARQLFATRCSEISGILNTIKKFTKKIKSLDSINCIEDKVNKFEHFVVCINGKEFYFFPIREYMSYLIQEQNQLFVNPNFDFDSVNIISC